MSMLGIDVGTTGCKAAAFSADGEMLAAAYEEYDIQRPRAEWAELDPREVWAKVRKAIGNVVDATKSDPVATLAVSSLGEATVPVSSGREILGPSILFLDPRGGEYLGHLRQSLSDERLYEINGNTWGNHYSLTKLMWIRDNMPEVHDRAHKFLLWSGFISFMLGAEPCVDYSLANRTLCFDVDAQTWSPTVLELAGIDGAKLPDTVPCGTVIGRVSASVGAELGLGAGVTIVAGAHDQCAGAVGTGAVEPGQAMYGMGTFLCAVPVFDGRPAPASMIRHGLNTEHHAVGGRFVSFIYNQGGCLVKWFRDTFAAAEHRAARQAGRDVYDDLFAEMPDEPSGVSALPHFTTTGPPRFLSDSCGLIAGLKLETTRGEILKGIVQGATFYLRRSIDALPAAGVEITEYRASGGGSKSERWLQLSADILGRPFVRPAATEAGSLGAAIIAGAGHGIFASQREGVDRMVRLDATFEPDERRRRQYAERFERYKRLEPMAEQYLAGE